MISESTPIDIETRLLKRVLVADGGTEGDPWTDHWNLTPGDSLLHKEAAAEIARLRRALRLTDLRQGTLVLRDDPRGRRFPVTVVGETAAHFVIRADAAVRKHGRGGKIVLREGSWTAWPKADITLT